MTTTIFLVELDAYHVDTGHTHRVYLATPPGFVSRRTDAVPDVVYAPLVEQAADVTLAIAAAGQTVGDTRVEIGLTLLANRGDPQLGTPILVYDVDADDWLTLPTGARPLNGLWTDYILGGRPITVLAGPRDGSRDNDFTAILTTTTEMPELGRLHIALRPRDAALDFDAPVLTATYGGTGGLDGTADLAGRTKERCFGHAALVQPTYLGTVTSSKPTFSGNGGNAIEGWVKVYDSYVELTEVTSGTPGAGQWRQDKSNGTFWLGDAAFGTITGELKGDKSGATWRVKGADIIKHLATTHSGIMDAGDVVAADVTALNTAAPYTLGIYLPAGDQTTLREVFDRVVQSFRGYWLRDSLGQLGMGQVLPPSGDPVRTLYRKVDHTGLVPRSPEGRAMPAKAAIIRYGRNYAPTDQAAVDRNVSGDARNLATNEWREARSSDDADVIAAYGSANARALVRETLIKSSADAATEAVELRDDAAVPRIIYDLRCTQLFTDVARLDVVRVYDDLPGFETGKLLRVIGVRINQRARISSFVLRE